MDGKGIIREPLMDGMKQSEDVMWLLNLARDSVSNPGCPNNQRDLRGRGMP